MKKCYLLFMLLVFFTANLIHAQFACPELLGTQTTTTTIHFKINAGTCNSYANQIFVSYQGYSATFTKTSCNGINLKYSSPPGQPLPVADSFSTSFPGGGVCQYINGALVTLSDNDVSLNEKVLIYPNPVLNGDHLTVKFKSNLSARLEIYNVTGKLVLTNVMSNDDKKEVSTNTLSNGIYMLKISTDEASTTRKVVIMK